MGSLEKVRLDGSSSRRGGVPEEKHKRGLGGGGGAEIKSEKCELIVQL